MILTVGQFIPRKGFDVLLKACIGLDNDIGIYFVGGSPTSEYIDLVERNNLRNVHFIGYKSKDDILKYYRAADVFVLPTREDIWGLVVNEALSCGIPVISTTQCGAALEQIKDGENGYIIDADDSVMLKRTIEKILDYPNPEIMKKNALMMARNYTIEKMMLAHMEMFNSN